MTRVVFDTNVLYSAILKPGSVPAQAFDLVTAGLVIPCVSDDVLAEYRLVLYRSELRLHSDRRRELLGHLSALSLHVAPTEKLTVSEDESDNRFLECAEASEAAYLVTGNLRHFPKTHHATRIVTARQLLTIVATHQLEEEE
jgi:putative PIN family toxin of toxin-antitoxin system